MQSTLNSCYISPNYNGYNLHHVFLFDNFKVNIH